MNTIPQSLPGIFPGVPEGAAGRHPRNPRIVSGKPINFDQTMPIKRCASASTLRGIRRARRTFMETSSPSIDLLWELSEIERKLATAPDAKGYLKLAAGYADAGWLKDAKRAVQQATALSNGLPVIAETKAPGCIGPCTPPVLLEIMRSLHLTGKSGDLRLEVPGGVSVTIHFLKGHVIDAQSSDTTRGENAWQRATSLPASSYHFKSGHPDTNMRSLQGSTRDMIDAFAKRIAA